MIVEKILGNIAECMAGDKEINKVYLEWFELDKKLLRKVTSDGEEVGIRIEGHLQEGDILYEDEKQRLVVDTLPTELTIVKVSTMEEMGRLCFELGNRHLSLAIEETRVSVPYDEPTYLYLEKLGFEPQKVKEKFTRFTVCNAHGNSHTNEKLHIHIGGQENAETRVY